MTPDQDTQDTQDRDRAVRTLLVEQVTQPTPTPLFPPERFRTGVVTAVVLVAIVAFSIVAVRFGADRSAPAQGGLTPSTSASATAEVPATMTVPAGTVLGSWTDEDGAVQKHTIHPNGLALSMVFTCSGGAPGAQYMIHIPHDEDQGGSCSGSSGGGGNKGVAGAVTLTITTTKEMRWSLTIVGVPETYVTPRPVPTPTDSAGSAVRYCTADDLTARFAAKEEPDGVTEVHGGDLAFTNRSTSTCALSGYPEVRFLDGSTPLGHHTMDAIDERTSMEHGLRAVVLKPGAAAYSQIDWYLANYYPENQEPRCDAVPVTRVRVDLAYDLTSPGQTGTLDVPIGSASACTQGAHGALGKYGQLSSTVFVDYSR